MSATRYTQSKPSPATRSKWSNLNSDLYAADDKARAEKTALPEVAGFAYIIASGRLQYAFAPHPIYEQGTWDVACIVANASVRLYELAPIEIGGESLHYAMNVANKTEVFDKVIRGQELDSAVLERTVWKDTPELVI